MPHPSSTYRVEPGAVIGGRYRLGGVLGRGGMAEVYDGRDLRLERPVAVKLLRPEMAARDDIRVRFQIEARAAAGLTHPNAVAVYDTGEHDGMPYLVMERLPGETLADRIAAGPVEPEWLTEAAEGVLDALAEAHAAGIVHRDVKPGNILVTAGGSAKIADFGIAKSSGGSADLTATGQLLGTPAYLAPERIDGAPATARSDLWALGVVLYEALARRKPFAGANPIEMAQAVAGGDHPPLDEVRPGLDPHLVEAVERAMARDPEHRFPDARAMASALRGRDQDATLPAAGPDGTATAADGTLVLPGAGGAAAGGAATAAGGAATAGRVSRRRRRRTAVWSAVPRDRWMAWALVAVLVVLVVGVLARAGDGGTAAGPLPARPATTKAPPPTPERTAAPAPAPESSLAQRLRDVAAGLDPARDGSRANDLASRLRKVATDLDEGSGTSAAANAAATLASAVAWNQAGALSDRAFTSALEVLSQVPGIQVTGGSQAPAATDPAPAAPGRSGDSGKGKAKAKPDDD